MRSAGTVGALTLLSRVLGLVRDVVLAALLGTGRVGDAWTAAFLIPNTLRRLVGEGNFSAAFVPVFSRVARGGSEADARRLAGRFLTAVVLAATALTAAGMVFAEPLVGFLFSGYAGDAGKLALTVRLTRAVFPYLLFISLTAALMAVLNARDRFGAAAFTPVLLNLAFIGAAAVAILSGRADPGQAVWIIAVGAVVGGLLQFAFLVPFARDHGVSFRPRWPFSDAAIREIGRLMVPGVFGVGIVQINIVVGRKLASGLEEGSVASLYYAARVNELTLGVFAVSIATVVLPLMSRLGASGHMDEFRSTFGFALRQVTLVTVPAMAGMILLRREITAVLFERGMFDAASTDLTQAALWGYAVGLVGVAAVRVAAPGFYALRDTRTPVLVAAVAMVVNVVGCLALRGPLANAGIALANSLAALVNAALLLALLRRRIGGGLGADLWRGVGRVGLATALMTLAVEWLRRGGLPGLPPAGETLGLGVVVAAGVGTYAVVHLLLRSPELAELRTVTRGSLPGTLGRSEDDAGGRS